MSGFLKKLEVRRADTPPPEQIIADRVRQTLQNTDCNRRKATYGRNDEGVSLSGDLHKGRILLWDGFTLILFENIA